jgi:pyruvate/2-oxoglutarate dehydrogenase complex dihydrolipoamide acyltransferase (E2) component
MFRYYYNKNVCTILLLQRNATTLSTTTTTNSFILTPAARSILHSAGIVEQIPGTGKGGRVTKEDALKRLLFKGNNSNGTISMSSTPANNKPTPLPTSTIITTATTPKSSSTAAVVNTMVQQQPPTINENHLWLPDSRGPAKLVPISNIRKVTAERLTESKQHIPHLYISMDVNIEATLEARAQLKRINGVTPSLNDFIIKASALALRNVPEINVKFVGNGKPIEKVMNVDISVAVATPRGLITPIVTKADEKSLTQISKDMQDLAKRARDNKLKPTEFIGGSFTISNLGMLGINDFTAVINPPQAAILAIGTGVMEFVPPSSSATTTTMNKNNNEIRIVDAKRMNRMTVTLSVDRRIINEAQAANFLTVFRALMESPTTL